MQRLQKQVIKEEIMQANHEERRRKSKQPSSLTIEQEERARHRFLSNQIKGVHSREQREIIEMINLNSNGHYDGDIYTRYKKYMQYEKGLQK